MITVEGLLKINKKGTDVELFLQTKLITDEVDIENYYCLLEDYKIQIRNKNKTYKTFDTTKLKPFSYVSPFEQEDIERILNEMRNGGVEFPDFLRQFTFV